MKLSVKLPLMLVLSVFLSALAVFVLGAYITRNSLRDIETQEQEVSVHTYADAANFYLEQARSLLETTAALPQITGLASAASVDPALHGVPADVAMPQRTVATSILENSDIFEYVMLLEVDGTIHLLEPYELQVKTLHGSLAFRDWYQELMSAGNTVISDLQISNATRQPCVTIATPVRDSAGQVIGIWAGGLGLEAFSQIGRAAPKSGALERYGYVTDSHGLVIAHQGNPAYVEGQTDFSSTPPVREALSGQDGAIQYVSPIDGQEELAAYTSIPDTGWAVVYVVPSQVVYAPLTQLLYTTLSITLAIAIVVAVVGLVVVRQTTRPLIRLTDYTRRIGRGELTAEMVIRGEDEVASVASDVRAMVGQLLQMHEKLRSSERLATLGQFSGNISHELRNPLGVIDSSVYYLQVRLKDADSKVQEHLDRIRLSVANCTAIIESLLNLTRMQAPVLTKLDLAAVARDAVATSKLPKAVVSKFDFPDGEVLVAGDHEQLRMAFKNIIKNASEAMQAKGTLTVTIRTAVDGWAEVSFADTGSGIAAEDMKSIFQPLFSRKAKGIGLGLAITKMVVDKHGGTIEARSEPGKGTTIVIRLRLHVDNAEEV